jgi:hypothetical protein
MAWGWRDGTESTEPPHIHLWVWDNELKSGRKDASAINLNESEQDIPLGFCGTVNFPQLEIAG